MADEAKLIAVVEARTAQFERALKRIETQSEATFRRTAASTRRLDTALAASTAHVNALGRSFATGLAPLITFAGVGAIVRNFIRESIEAERVVAQLNQTLASTGGAAGLASGELQDLAARMQTISTFSDEAIIGAEALLLTFTKIGADVFPQAVSSILDMSVALGQDLKASALQVGKALQDPVTGITALRRVGVNFSEDQKVVIRRLVETGELAKAQGIILKELQVEFGGSAQAARDTLGGALTALGNAWSDLFELSTTASGGLRQAIEQLIDEIEDPAFKEFVNLIGVVLVDGFADVAREASQFATQIRELAQIAVDAQTGLAGFFNRVTDFQRSVEASTGLNKITDALEISDPVTRRLEDAARTVNEMTTDLELAARLRRQAAEAGGDLIAGPAPGGSERLQQIEESEDAIEREAEAERARLEAAQAGDAQRARSASNIERQKERVVELIASLEEELGLIGASDTEQRIANELRRAGAQATDEQKARIAELVTAVEAENTAHQRMVNAMETIRSTARDVLGGFISDLVHGKSATDALASALERLVDKLLDMALNSLFSGGGLGFLFGGKAGTKAAVHHQGGIAGQATAHRYVPASTFAHAPRYHAGGIAGLRPGEVPAILRAGELIIPNGPRRMGNGPPIQVVVKPEIINNVPNTSVEVSDGRGQPRFTVNPIAEAIGGSRAARGKMGLPPQLKRRA